MRDRKLIRACIEGATDAWPRFVSRYHRLVLFLLQCFCTRYRILRTQEDLEDLCQEVFLRLVEDGFRRLRKYDPSRPFEAYLRVVCRSAAIDFARRRGRLPDPLPEDLAVLPELAEPRSAPELIERIEEAVAELSPRDRYVVKLHFYQDLSTEELARTLGLSVNTVGPLINRVKKRIRKRLEDS